MFKFDERLMSARATSTCEEEAKARKREARDSRETKHSYNSGGIHEQIEYSGALPPLPPPCPGRLPSYIHRLPSIAATCVRSHRPRPQASSLSVSLPSRARRAMSTIVNSEMGGLRSRHTSPAAAAAAACRSNARLGRLTPRAGAYTHEGGGAAPGRRTRRRQWRRRAEDRRSAPRSSGRAA